MNHDAFSSFSFIDRWQPGGVDSGGRDQLDVRRREAFPWDWDWGAVLAAVACARTTLVAPEDLVPSHTGVLFFLVYTVLCLELAWSLTRSILSLSCPTTVALDRTELRGLARARARRPR
jgi:hypothetical protein